MSADSPARWQVRDYVTARAALTHPSLTRAAALGQCADVLDVLDVHVLNHEGVAHARLRASLAAAIAAVTPRAIRMARPYATELVARLQGEVDVAGSFVRPFVLLLVDDLFGFSGGDPDELRWWHSAVLATDADAMPPTRAAIRDRLRALVMDRRITPRDDVTSRLAGDHTLTEPELLATLFFAFGAAYVNLTNFFGLAMLSLAQHPAEYTRLRGSPAGVSRAVEELLRFAEPPGRAALRVAACDADVAGTRIRAGTIVHIFRAAANRDPCQFGGAQLLDLRRVDPQPSLAFGAGPHYCLGASLVRTIADLWLLTLLNGIETMQTTVRTALQWDFAQPLWLSVWSAAAPAAGRTIRSLDTNA